MRLASGRHTWMLLGGAGEYSASAQSDRYGGNQAGLWTVEGHTGLRYVFNPGKAFEFSSYVMAGASHERRSTTDPVQIMFSTGLNAKLGISIDRELTDGVGVRISSNIASGGWSHTTYEYLEYLDGGAEEAGFYAAVGLQPVVELRMTF
jgi:hypothetical protein